MADATDAKPVLVGVDDAEGQDAVVRYAAHEAAIRGVPLEIAHVIPLPGPLASVAEREDREPRGGTIASHGASVVDRFEAVAAQEHPDLLVTGRLLFGDPGAALLERSAEADLVVLGHRGGGGFPRLPLGSVSLQLATHSRCPVVVIRPGREIIRQGGRIAVGADLVHYSPEALEFAFAEATRRGAGVQVVHVLYRPPLLPGPVIVPEVRHGVHEVEAGARQFLDARIAEARERHPGVPVDLRIEWAHPARVLVDLCDNFDLVVVGSRGRKGLRRFFLGSVSSEVLHTAQCPVAVVPAA